MMLAKFAGEHRDDWDDLLLAVMMAYRSSVHETSYPVIVLLLTWTHMLLFLWWCALLELCFCMSWTCLTVRICLTVLPCQASWTTPNYLTNCTFSIMHTEWLVPMAPDGRYCMLPLNDMCWNSKVDLTSPGVVTLDTTVVPDVFGLHAFDDRAPVVRVLPGDFLHTVRMLDPDDCANPVGFHDVHVENLSNSLSCLTSTCTVLTSLRQCWPSSLFSAMNRCQADMEALHRDCKREF